VPIQILTVGQYYLTTCLLLLWQAWVCYKLITRISACSRNPRDGDLELTFARTPSLSHAQVGVEVLDSVQQAQIAASAAGPPKPKHANTITSKGTSNLNLNLISYLSPAFPVQVRHPSDAAHIFALWSAHMLRVSPSVTTATESRAASDGGITYACHCSKPKSINMDIHGHIHVHITHS
jgi:hypothetical protein